MLPLLALAWAGAAAEAAGRWGMAERVLCSGAQTPPAAASVATPVIGEADYAGCASLVACCPVANFHEAVHVCAHTPPR